MSERVLWRLLEWLLAVAAAGIWFGNTGMGLSVLLIAARSRPASVPPPESLLTAEIQWIWLGRSRILVRCARQGRLEVYRDELNADQWAALRRALIARPWPAGEAAADASAVDGSQPATGRSTSIWSP